MSPAQTGGFTTPIDPSAWAWWEKRRLGYNIALGLAGWAAYGLNAAMFLGFHHPIWMSIQGGVSMTLFLGTGFLLVMGLANILYLLGVLTESIVAPADRDAFRKRALALGFWGSVAVPFIFPLANLAFLINASPF